ncbi:MarR family winged helix-turn-helix transcriptional regulator [Klenkia brasiliensis]|uniref:DNA-binding transcriptional regulator, MarR family n=1 Tax=Klenkia brasiliensis TaxID=333142 RepID=A0A1G7PBD4_9ACTN|nr:MarR family winged helix-turn-helix transcriptional regulator [Klenkia brasiliensis]SDF83531.1 DNA-binding transcriptional regulator, MarR family [Klenkia brasiliensis]
MARLAPQQLEVYFALMEAASLLQYAVEQQLRDDGPLSWVQFQVLAGLALGPRPSERMTDIADRVVHSRSGLTYQAGVLEKRGLVTRSPDPADDRGTVVTITDAGRALVEQVLPGHEDVVQGALLDHLDPDDTGRLTALLQALRDRMRARPPRSARRR